MRRSSTICCVIFLAATLDQFPMVGHADELTDNCRSLLAITSGNVRVDGGYKNAREGFVVDAAQFRPVLDLYSKLANSSRPEFRKTAVRIEDYLKRYSPHFSMSLAAKSPPKDDSLLKDLGRSFAMSQMQTAKWAWMGYQRTIMDDADFETLVYPNVYADFEKLRAKPSKGTFTVDRREVPRIWHEHQLSMLNDPGMRQTVVVKNKSGKDLKDCFITIGFASTVYDDKTLERAFSLHHFELNWPAGKEIELTCDVHEAQLNLAEVAQMEALAQGLFQKEEFNLSKSLSTGMSYVEKRIDQRSLVRLNPRDAELKDWISRKRKGLSKQSGKSKPRNR